MRATLHGLVRLVPLVLSARAGTYFTPTAKIESCDDTTCDTMVLELPVAHFGEESVSYEIFGAEDGTSTWRAFIAPLTVTLAPPSLASRHELQFVRTVRPAYESRDTLGGCLDCKNMHWRSGLGFCCTRNTRRSNAKAKGTQTVHCLNQRDERWKAYQILEGHVEYTLTLRIVSPTIKDSSTNDIIFSETSWLIESNGSAQMEGDGTIETSWAELSLGSGAEGLEQSFLTNKTFFQPYSPDTWDLVTDDFMEHGVLLPPELVDLSGMTLVTGVGQSGWDASKSCGEVAGAWEITQLDQIWEADQARALLGNRPEYWIKGHCMGSATGDVVGDVSFLVCPVTKYAFYSSLKLHASWQNLTNLFLVQDDVVESESISEGSYHMIIVAGLLMIFVLCVGCCVQRNFAKKKKASEERNAPIPQNVGSQHAFVPQQVWETSMVQYQSDGRPMRSCESCGPPMMSQQSFGPPMMSQQSCGPPVMSYPSDGPPMMSYPSDGPPIMSQQSCGPPMMSHQSCGPPMMSYQSDGPPMMSYQLDGPPMMSYQPDGPTMMSCQPDGPPIMSYQSDGPPMMSYQLDGPPMMSYQPDGPTMMSCQPDGPPIMSYQSDGPPMMSNQWDGPPIMSQQSRGLPMMSYR